MESRTCRLLPVRTAEADGVTSGKYLFAPGTILYSSRRPYLRKAVFADFQGLCSADVYPIRVARDDIDPHFLKWSLVAEPFTAYANSLSGRTRMPKLNRRATLRVSVLPPSHRHSACDSPAIGGFAADRRQTCEQSSRYLTED